MKKVMAAVAVAAVALTLTGCQAEERRVAGSMSITSNGSIGFTSSDGGATCVGYDGFSDITEGAQVTIKDASGKTIGAGSLETGRIVDGSPRACEFKFVITEVPSDSKLYSVAVGNSGRGAVTYTKDEMFSTGPRLAVAAN